MSGIPTNPPNTKTIDWGAQVRRYWGDQWNQKEVVYVFSNGRQFKDSGPNSGIYDPE